MKIVNIHEAKSTLSKLIERVRKGDEILIGKAGHPVAKLSAYDLPNKQRVPGSLKGRIKIAKDFDKVPA